MEKREVEEIKLCEASINEFINHIMNNDEGYNFDSCLRTIDFYNGELSDAKFRLQNIRKDIKEYFSFFDGIVK